MYDYKEKQSDGRVDKLIKELVDYGMGQLESIDFTAYGECLEDARRTINDQPTLLDLFAPIKVIGSLYGHFTGLIKLFQFAGWPSEVSYVFLGNYVDYGPQSLQTILFLLLLKIKYPQTIFLLKGSHELPFMHKLYTFHSECKKKHSEALWKSICEVLAYLPYAAVIDRRIFCVSGGIGPDLENIKDIEGFDRNVQLVGEGPEVDLVFSQPDRVHYGFSKHLQGMGYLYGRDSLDRFLAINGLQLLCRSRHVLEEGFEHLFDKKLLNLFSAPNFANKFNNPAAILAISTSLHCEIQLYRPKKQAITAADLL